MSSKCNQVASFAANMKAIYLASVENKVTVGCLLERQLIGPLLSIKMKPDVDFRLFLSLA